ncbi:unnamed protein product [Oppiella nova]|uniref:Uncharacterized protein n=1 Tax=Oppiella nova TaxID=334625 RepID=A0A7R9LGL0_9ACAR|nr:unnamed protein product [Oppiella nova]CAG2163480.1 unnamed protein product [Oppiella nova]
MEDTGAHVVDTTVDAIAEPVESSATPERTSEGTAADNGHNGGGDNDNEANDGNSGEEMPDMMAILYGNEEEADADDDEDDFVANTTTVSQESNTGSVGGVVKAEVVGTAGVAEGPSTGATDSGRKRRSDEANDSSQSNSKRIKPELMSPPRSRSQESVPPAATIPLTTTCEQIEVEEELPKDSRHFMTYILSLSGNDLEAKDMTELSIHSKLNDITRTLEFRSMDTFLESFVPFVIMDLWRNAKQEWGSRPKRVLGRKCSIMTKWKTNRMFDGLELKCISVIGSDEKPHFRFGQLAMLQTAIQTKADSNQHTIGRRKYLAYITSHTYKTIPYFRSS